MMKHDSLSIIGKTIKQFRKEKKLNLKDLAEKSNVTAGLLSKIENYRAVPSLPVLHSIAKALEVNMADLVKQVNIFEEDPFVLIRKNMGEIEEREDSKGIIYESLISQDISGINFRAVICRTPPKAYREPISNSGMQMIHVIDGKMEYMIGESKVLLESGDTIYFDGNIPHSYENLLDREAIEIAIYLLRH
jgi:transcriptional regulator with XRE-family HTH domain